MANTMSPVEVITRTERRRRYTPEEKGRLVAESARHDRTVSQVARAHGIAPGLLFTWRRQFLAAAIGGNGADSAFVPVQLTAPSPAADANAVTSSPIGPRIELRLPSGVVISVTGDGARETLQQVLSALLAR
jgi:transposase